MFVVVLLALVFVRFWFEFCCLAGRQQLWFGLVLVDRRWRLSCWIWFGLVALWIEFVVVCLVIGFRV